ncbi:hypothetical protein [Cryptosporangium sp. NPDC048952]|uniref:hypothetical protein n=1 Tax=Cryptosporangium sp. NPDC048952 TaxID=3363961 RepID=UPI003721A8AA
MEPFAVSVPDAEVRRSEVVIARVARKVAPLFGVVWDQNPYDCTWVSDFRRITLAEIARGAPFPSREQQSALDAQNRDDPQAMKAGTYGAGWALRDRAVWTPNRAQTPTGLANATVNRFGPDTKAAVVLAGANRLFETATAAIEDVCRRSRDAAVDPAIRMAMWAGMIVETYRAQPALVSAALQARAIQRALLLSWSDRMDSRGLADGARSEPEEPEPYAGPTDADPDSNQPDQFNLLDVSVRAVGAIDDYGAADGDEIRNDLVDYLTRLLLSIGSSGHGMLWVRERPTDHRTMQAHLRVADVAVPLVSRWSRLTGGHLPSPSAPNLPTPELFRALTPTARSAYAVAAYAAAEYTRVTHPARSGDTPFGWNSPYLTETASLAAQYCDRHDVALLLLDCHRITEQVAGLCADPARNDAELEERVQRLDRFHRLLGDRWRRDRMSAGTASMLLETVCLTLDRASTILGRPEQVEVGLERRWRDALSSRELTDDLVVSGAVRTIGTAKLAALSHYTAYRMSRSAGDELGPLIRLQEMILEVEPRNGPEAPLTRARLHAVAALGYYRRTDVDDTADGALDHALLALRALDIDAVRARSEPAFALVELAEWTLPPLAGAVRTGLLEPDDESVRLAGCLLDAARDAIAAAGATEGSYEQRSVAGLANVLADT